MLKSHPFLISAHAQVTLLETWLDFTGQLIGIFNWTLSFCSLRQAKALKRCVYMFYGLLVQVHKLYRWGDIVYLHFRCILTFLICYCYYCGFVISVTSIQSSLFNSRKVSARLRYCTYKRWIYFLKFWGKEK